MTDLKQKLEITDFSFLLGMKIKKQTLIAILESKNKRLKQSQSYREDEMKKATPEQIDRKMKKLARTLAEANTWSDVENRKTLKDFYDVWAQAFQLIRLAGYRHEMEKREKQIRKARGVR